MNAEAIDNIDLSEYEETRIDITGYVDNNAVENIISFLSTGFERKGSPVIDLSLYSEGENKIYVNRVYCGDSIQERYGYGVVEQYDITDDGVLYKGQYSRLMSISLQKGFHVDALSQHERTPSQYDDFVTVRLNDNIETIIPVMSLHRRIYGGSVISQSGDTISNVVTVVNEYRFATSSDAKPNYQSVRILSTEFPSAIFEWEKYNGWNDERVSATIIASTSGKKKNKNAGADISFDRDIQYIAISDLSGRIIERGNPDEIMKRYHLIPNGWYIITEYREDKTVSEKRYIKSQKL